MIGEGAMTENAEEAVGHCLFGTCLLSRFPFENRLAAPTGPPQLTFECVSAAPASGWTNDKPIYASANRIDARQSFLYVYRAGDHDVLRFSEVADFHVWPERIVCHLLDPDYRFMVEIHLLGFVLSYWLERQGILALHAAAVVINGRAVAFLATNKGGKTSLAASLMQLGNDLLTDDILPVERVDGAFSGRPGYPQMRMWPDQAAHFVGSYQALEVVHPRLSKRRVPVGSGAWGSFCNASRLIGCIYVPERGGAKRVEIAPLSWGEAVVAITRHSFLNGVVEAMGWHTRRFQPIAQLAKTVPVRRIAYPNGVEHLPSVRQAILDDVAAL